MALNIAQRLVSPPTGYVRPLNEVHTEYPKFVHFADKRPSVIVQDRGEEERVLAGAAPAPVEPPPPPASAPVANLVGTNDEKTMLLKIAADKGIRIDGRWKLPKIRKAIEVATAI